MHCKTCIFCAISLALNFWGDGVHLPLFGVIICSGQYQGIWTWILATTAICKEKVLPLFLLGHRLLFVKKKKEIFYKALDFNSLCSLCSNGLQHNIFILELCHLVGKTSEVIWLIYSSTQYMCPVSDLFLLCP